MVLLTLTAYNAITVLPTQATSKPKH